MTLRTQYTAAVFACGALFAATPIAGAAVLKTVVSGRITSVAVEGNDVAYVTNINSKACPAPILGDRQQVVYLNARTGKSVLLTTDKGCDTLTGPGLGLDAGHWLGITHRHVYWIEASYSGDHSYIGVDVATPGTKPVRGSLDDYGVFGSSSVGPLVAWGGRGYVNFANISFRDIVGCGAFPRVPRACDPVVSGGGVSSFDAAGGKTPFLASAAPLPKILQSVGASGALLLDPNGALTLVNGSTSTPLAGSSVDEAAMSGSMIAGLAHAGAKVRLSFWNTNGARSGACTAAVGVNTPGVAVAGKTAVFATRRGIYAVKAPTGTRTACRATKLVNLPAGTRLASFALTSAAGLVYATNTGTKTKTLRGVLTRLTTADLRTRGYCV